jgi:hypothetical protein
MYIIKKIELKEAGDTVGCMGGNCPSFLITESGDVLVQGYAVPSKDKEGLGIPPTEDVVCLPAPMLAALVKKLNHV